MIFANRSSCAIAVSDCQDGYSYRDAVAFQASALSPETEEFSGYNKIQGTNHALSTPL